MIFFIVAVWAVSSSAPASSSLSLGLCDSCRLSKLFDRPFFRPFPSAPPKLLCIMVLSFSSISLFVSCVGTALVGTFVGALCRLLFSVGMCGVGSACVVLSADDATPVVGVVTPVVGVVDFVSPVVGVVVSLLKF